MKKLNRSRAETVCDQRGQAVAEAILSVAVLSIIFIGIAWIAQLQNEALSAAQTSRQAAFGHARGQTTTGAQGTPGVLSASYGKSSSNVLPISNNAQARVLAKDWLSLNAETLTVWAQADKRRFLSLASHGKLELSSMVDRGLGIRRQTSLITGAGHASSDTAAQQRVATSTAGWLSATNLSMQAARQEKSRMHSVDAVWKRGALTHDWLTPWVRFGSRRANWRKKEIAMIQRSQLYVMNLFACFALAIVVSMPVFAAPRVALTLPPGSHEVPLGEQLRLYGVPVAIRVFDAPLGLPALAQWLSDQHPGLTELSVMPGKIVLSGMLEDALCTVLMESQGAKRTAGSISLLNASLKTPARTAAFAGMPSEARLRLDFSSIESGERVTQQVWSSSWPLERLRPVLHSGLRNTGWKTIQNTAHSELWQRGSSRLQVALMLTEEGTGIWTLQQDAL